MAGNDEEFIGARDVGEPMVQTLRDSERITVQAFEDADGFGYRARFSFSACGSAVRDEIISTERYDDAEAALQAGLTRGGQLAGIDVPEA